MKAVIYQSKDQPLKPVDIDKPNVSGNELLIKVSHCGVCGSDIHAASEGVASPGTVLGHEFSGEITAVGEEVLSAQWKIGERVTALPGFPCERCTDCKNKQHDLCSYISPLGFGTEYPGAYAEYVKVSSKLTVKIPPKVSMQDAALVEPLAVTLNAWRKVNPKKDDVILIVGAGPIGLSLVKWAKYFGVSYVAVSEKVKESILRAELAGANCVIDANQELNPVKAIKRKIGRFPNIIFECVGAPLLQKLLMMAPSGSHICLLGACMESEEVLISAISTKNLSLSIPFGYGKDEFSFILDLLSRDEISTDTIISKVISLDQVPETFEILRKPNDQCKVLISNES